MLCELLLACYVRERFCYGSMEMVAYFSRHRWGRAILITVEFSRSCSVNEKGLSRFPVKISLDEDNNNQIIIIN